MYNVYFVYYQIWLKRLTNYTKFNKVDVLYVLSTELHAALQNRLPAIRTLRVKETIQNIHHKRTKYDNCGSYIGVVSYMT